MDAAHLATKVTTATSDSQAVTVSATAKVLVLVESTRHDSSGFSATKLATVSVGGQAFTALTGYARNDDRGVRIWYIEAPPTGSQTVSWTRTTAADQGVVAIGEITHSAGVQYKASSDAGSVTFAQSISDSPGVAVVSGDILIGGICFVGDSGTDVSWDDANVTELAEADDSGTTVSYAKDITTTGTPTVAVSQDQGVNKTLCIALAIFEPAPSITPPTNYTATDAGDDTNVEHLWTNQETTYRKQIWRWDDGEDPDTDPGTSEGIWPATANSANTPLPTTAGTYTYKLAIIDTDDSILGWALDEPTVTVGALATITPADAVVQLFADNVTVFEGDHTIEIDSADILFVADAALVVNEDVLPQSIELWDDVEANGGERLHVLTRDALPGGETFRVDGRDRLDLPLTAVDPVTGEVRGWAGDLLLDRVIRVQDGVSDQPREWRISDIEDGRGEDEGRLLVVGAPTRLDLATRALVRHPNSGSDTAYNVGLIYATPSQYISTLIVPSLTEQGVSYISLGDIEFTDRYDLSVDGASCQELLRELENVTGGEIDFRREGTSGYKIDLVEQRGAGAPTLFAQAGRQLGSLGRSQRRGRFATVLVPRGRVPEGAAEASGIAFAAWEIATLTVDSPSAGQTTITAVDPAGGDAPIKFADQFGGASNNHYLRKPDGTLTEIVDSAVPGTFVLADGSGLSVGDHFEVRADSSGSLLTELTNPAAIATYGRNVRVFRVDSERGERNVVPNGLGATWPSGDLPTGWSEVNGTVETRKHDRTLGLSDLAGNADGAQTSDSTIDLKNLTAGATIQAGDHFRNDTSGLHAAVLEEATVGGGGTVTVTLTALMTVADNDAISIVRPTLEGGGGGNAIFVPMHNAWPTINPLGLRTDSYRVLYDSRRPTVHFAAFLTVRNYNRTGNSVAIDPATPKQDPPTLRLYDANSGLQLASEQAEAFTIESEAEQGVVIRGTYEIDQDRDLYLVIQGVRDSDPSTFVDQGTHTFVRAVMIYTGTDAKVPPIDGAHATRLWQRANRKLVDSSQVPVTYRSRMRDLRRASGFLLADETPTLGGAARVKDTLLGIDLSLRIVELRYPVPFTREDVVLTLDTTPARQTEASSQATPRPVFVNVDVTASGEVATKSSATPLPDTVGAERGVGSPAASTGTISLKPFTRSQVE